MKPFNAGKPITLDEVSFTETSFTLKLRYFSHRHADKLLTACGLLPELDAAFSNLVIPVFPGKSDAKDHRAGQQTVLQPVLNTLIELMLARKGWLLQPQVKAKLDATRTRYFADFYKEAQAPASIAYVGDENASLQVLMEVQFANTARSDSDLKKFNIGFSQGRCDVGVLVVPDKRMAACMSSNVANFEYVVDGLVELGQLMAPVPVLVVGLTQDDAPLVDLSLSRFTSAKQLTGRGSKRDRVGAAHALLQGVELAHIGPGMDAPVNPELLQAGEGDDECIEQGDEISLDT